MILGLFNATRFAQPVLPLLIIKVNLRIAMLRDNILVSYFVSDSRKVNMNWESQALVKIRRKIQ